MKPQTHCTAGGRAPKGGARPYRLDILYVISGLNLGGTERHLSQVARALAQTGMNVGVYSLAGDGPVRRDLEQSGINVMFPPMCGINATRSPIARALGFGLAGLHLIFLMLRKSPRIVHFFLPAAYIVGGSAAIIARVKIRVVSRRSLNLYQRRASGTRFIERYLHRSMSGILGNSRAVIAELHEEGVPDDKLALIYNGIACDDPPNCARIQTRFALGIEDGTLVFVVVANLIPYKGHLDLMEAIRMAHEQMGMAWRLLIVGRDDGVGPEILAAAKRYAIEDHVILLGARRDVSALLSASDVGVLCSHEEGFSNAVLEGMAAGLPMIVTDVGGNAEAVRDGRTGCVVPPRDPEALADAIIRLAHDSDLRKRYGSSGRARIDEHFTIDTCVAKYAALYRGLMDGRLPRDIVEVQDQIV